MSKISNWIFAVMAFALIYYASALVYATWSNRDLATRLEASLDRVEALNGAKP